MTSDVTNNIRSLLSQILDRPNAELKFEDSLTIDIGFDSMQLMQFFAGVENYYPKVRLEEWFLEQSLEGQDTIQSLLQFISKKNSSIEAVAA